MKTIKATIRVTGIDWETRGVSPRDLGLPSRLDVETKDLDVDVDEGWNMWGNALERYLDKTYRYFPHKFNYRFI